MEERKYAYMVRYNKSGETVCIMWHLGKYSVARVYRKKGNVLNYVLRQYKTLSGAERFLTSRSFVEDESDIPEYFYGTEAEIKEGKYWRE